MGQDFAHKPGYRTRIVVACYPNRRQGQDSAGVRPKGAQKVEPEWPAPRVSMLSRLAVYY